NNFGGLRARARQDTTTPKLIRNEFGASEGGRIVRNKTFWFGSYEGQRLRQASFSRAAAPTDAMWNGGSSNAITQENERITIYDPNTTATNGTRQPFAGNVIPKDRISSYASVMRSVSAPPSGSNQAGNPWISQNFETFYPQPRDFNTVTGKVDQVFSEKDHVS